MNILITAQCGKLTSPNNPTITYDIAIDSKSKLHLRINKSETGGMFSQEWIACDDIIKTLNQCAGHFSSTVLTRLYQSNSANNSGYLAAVLRHEDIIESVEGKVRVNRLKDTQAFEKRLAKLAKAAKYLPDTLAQTNA